MSKKNGKIKGQVITERDPLAREFRPMLDPIKVHNDRLAHEKRMREIEREEAKEPVSSDKAMFWARKWIDEVRKHHPSTLTNFPAARNPQGVGLRPKSAPGVEIRLGVIDEPETEDQAND